MKWTGFFLLLNRCGKWFWNHQQDDVQKKNNTAHFLSFISLIYGQKPAFVFFSVYLRWTN